VIHSDKFEFAKTNLPLNFTNKLEAKSLTEVEKVCNDVDSLAPDWSSLRLRTFKIAAIDGKI